MNKILIAATLAILVVAALGIAAYTYFGAARDTQSAAVLRVALASFSAETLDPSLDTQDGLRYHGHMHDHLVGADADGRMDARFGLLESWSANGDGSEFTLTLRPNVKWHDGETATAADIPASLEYYFRQGAACGVCGILNDKIADIQTTGDRAVSVRLNRPDVVFPALLAPIEGDTPLLPARAIANHNGSAAALDENPIGGGPWRFAERSPADYVRYEAFPDYWDETRIPAFGALRLTQVPEEDARIALLDAGQVDIAPISATAIPAMKDKGFGVDGPKNVVSTTLRFFMSYDPDYLTSRLEFRQALAVSVDMPRIVEALYPPEAASPATGSALFTPVSPGYIPDLPAYPHDLQLARDLLTQSGYAGEPVSLLSLTAYGISEMPRINEMIAAHWQEVGVNAQIIPTEWPAVQALFTASPQRFGEYAPAPVLHGAAPARPGGDLNGLRRYISGADGAMLTYHAPNIGDGMLAQVAATANAADRAIVLQALNRRTYAEYWAIPVMWRHDAYAISPAITGWRPTNGTSSTLRFETAMPAP